MEDAPVTIGRILRPHGVCGEVRVLPLTEFPERFLSLQKVLVGDRGENRQYDVKGATLHGKAVLVRLYGVDSIEAAESLRGKDMMVPPSERVNLPPDHYFVYEVLGMQCFKSDGDLVGEVKQVLQTAANDVYVVEGADGVHLVPGVKAIVKEIDVAARRMVVDWIDGM
jgi:16S rRNA processing protein RimM